MKFFFDLLPVVLFFVTFRLFDIFVATLVLMGSTLAQAAWMKYRTGKVDTMLLVTAVVVVIFGGATVAFHNEIFIKWKPSILYFGLSATLLFSHLLWGKNLIRSLGADYIELPNPIWQRLNYAWSLFFLLLGILNLVVAFYTSTATWVNFKLFGTTGLMVLFMLSQFASLKAYWPKEEA